MSINKLVGLLSLIILTSCGQNSEVFIPDTEFGDISRFYEQVSLKPESQTINSQENFLFTSSSGLKIYVPAHSFENSKGEEVKGMINMDFLTMNSIGDFIINNMNTQSESGVLISPIAFSIQFKSSQEEIFPKDENSIKVMLDSNDEETNVSVFSWNGNVWLDQKESESPSAILNYTTWELPVGSGTVFGKGYLVDLYKTSWLAIGRNYAQDVESNDVCINLPQGYNNMNTKTYLFSSKEKFVIELSQNESTGFCNYQSQFIPKIHNVSFLTLSSKGLDYYLGYLNVETLGSSYDISPRSINKAQLINEINAY